MKQANVQVEASVTGDEALVLARPGELVTNAEGIGFNVRMQQYSGVGSDRELALRNAITAVRRALDGVVVPLPITHNHTGADDTILRKMLDDEAHVKTLRTPAELADEVEKCRLVITGSYHAAVFSLARGIPVVGLTATAYYDGKFSGLEQLYPLGAVQQISFDDPTWESDLVDSAKRGWALPPELRQAIATRSTELVERCRSLWDSFAEKVQIAGVRT